MTVMTVTVEMFTHAVFQTVAIAVHGRGLQIVCKTTICRPTDRAGNRKTAKKRWEKIGVHTRGRSTAAARPCAAACVNRP